MLRSIPPNTSIGGSRSRRSITTRIPLNFGSSSFGNIKSHGNRSSGSIGAKRKGKVAMHDYQKMGVKTLEKLLVEGSKLKNEMTMAVKVLPSNDNLEKLDKLGLIIEQLKYQIEGKK